MDPSLELRARQFPRATLASLLQPRSASASRSAFRRLGMLFVGEIFGSHILRQENGNIFIAKSVFEQCIDTLFRVSAGAVNAKSCSVLSGHLLLAPFTFLHDRP